MENKQEVLLEDTVMEAESENTKRPRAELSTSDSEIENSDVSDTETENETVMVDRDEMESIMEELKFLRAEHLKFQKYFEALSNTGKSTVTPTATSTSTATSTATATPKKNKKTKNTKPPTPKKPAKNNESPSASTNQAPSEDELGQDEYPILPTPPKPTGFTVVKKPTPRKQPVAEPLKDKGLPVIVTYQQNPKTLTSLMKETTKKFTLNVVNKNVINVKVFSLAEFNLG
ncbi:uncharacterized protein DMAD_13757 [Drosophila madeirensis]